MILPYSVTFVGDFFSTTVSVEVDTEEPDIMGFTGEQLEDVAIDLAKNMMEYHYGWKIADASNEVAVVAG